MAKTPTKKSDIKEKAGPKLIVDNTVLTMVIKKADWKPVYTKLLNRSAKRIKVDGFRKGKVPAHIAKQNVNKEYLYQGVLDQLVPGHYEELIKTEKKFPITYPEFKPVDMSEEDDWKIEVQIAETPKVSIKGYKKVVKTAKKDAEKEWKKVSDQPKADHPKGGKADDARKKDPKAPEQTEEQRKAAQEEFVSRAIFSKLVQELKPSVQELIVKRETEHDLQELRQNLERVGMTVDQYLQGRNLTVEQVTQDMAAGALAKIQLTFILGKITQEENLLATEKECQEYIDALPDEKAKKHYSKPEHKEAVSRIVSQNKLTSHLLSL